MKFFILALVFVFSWSGSLLAQLKPGSPNNKNTAPPLVLNYWTEDVYQIRTIPLATDYSASWLYIDPLTGTGAGSPEKTDEVVAHFYKQADNRRAKGIFIYSHYYAAPSTGLSSSFLMLYNNKKWREAEKVLVEQLQAACEAQRIPLYVNTDRVMTKPWRILVPPRPPDKKP